MRKQTKLAVVLSAVAVLALGCVATFAKGWVQVNGQWFYENASGEFVTEKIESSGNSKFYLGSDGAMVTDTFVEDYDGNGYSYYFGSNGAMVTNTWVAIDPSIVQNTTDNAPSAYWYYFGSNGKSFKSNSGLSKKTVDGKKYAFNDYGQMLTGWISENGDNQDEEDDPFATSMYYAGGENDGVLRSGWVAYYDSTDITGANDKDYSDKDVLWFYFSTSNFKKTEGKTKTVDGKKYDFEDGTGIMKSEWVKQNLTDYKYYSADTDGHMVKKGWIYAVPEDDQDHKKHDDDEEQWFYAKSSGLLEVDKIAKINGKYYAFNAKGVMKTGLVLFDRGHFVDKIDLEYTNVDDLLKANKYKSGSEKEYAPIYNTTGYYAIHYFGKDGDRKTGEMTLEFADDEATFYSDNNGGKRNYNTKKKKFYHNGLLCKASADIKYGLVVKSDADESSLPLEGWKVAKNSTSLVVVTTSGAKALSKDYDSAVKKDADGNYWVINKGRLAFITTTEVKYSNYTGNVTDTDNKDVKKYAHASSSSKVFQFKSNIPDNVDSTTWTYTTSKEGWVPFQGSSLKFDGTALDTSKLCSTEGRYMTLDNLDTAAVRDEIDGIIAFNDRQGYNLNFFWED